LVANKHFGVFDVCGLCCDVWGLYVFEWYVLVFVGYWEAESVGLQLAFNVRGTHNKGYFNGASTVTLSTAVGGEKDWVGALRNLVAGNSLDMFSRKNLNKI
jgi:hypothetical protein